MLNYLYQIIYFITYLIAYKFLRKQWIKDFNNSYFSVFVCAFIALIPLNALIVCDELRLKLIKLFKTSLKPPKWL